MKKGFTLLELIVVIIIIGILATLGFTQYARMIERSRGAEARAIAGNIRTMAGGYRMEKGTLAGFTPVLAGIGAAGGIPGPAAANCTGNYYFWYNIAVAEPVLTVTATRCTASGKVPNWTAPGAAPNLILTTNLGTGVDDWGGTYGY